jgi:hypothetical protein
MQIKLLISIATLLSCALLQATTITFDSATMLDTEQRTVLHQPESVTVKKIIHGLIQQLPTRWQSRSCMHGYKTAEEKRLMLNDGNTTVYICIGCYHAPRLTITLMRYENEPQDLHAPKGLLIPQQSAHKMIKKNGLLTDMLQQELASHLQHHYYMVQPFIIAPIKQLMGLTIPALYIDIGLSAEQDIPCIVEVLSDVITRTIVHLYEK